MPDEHAKSIETEYVTAREAAKILSVSPWQIYHLRTLGLRAYSPPGTKTLRFRVSDLRALMQPAEYVYKPRPRSRAARA